MASKHYGCATYQAFRSGGFLHLIASGETPNLNDQVLLEQLPFLIYPPLYGLFFVTQDVSLPTLKPFTVEIQTLFPDSASSVRVQDADGDHSVPISSLGATAPSVPVHIGNDFCVFQWIGGEAHMIAKCDAIVPAVYTHAFGPDTYDKCSEYIRDHNGA
jgi:hypothetical protein